MAGYWPCSFFCVFMDRDGVEVHKHAKKEQGQYPAILTEQAYMYMAFEKIFLAEWVAGSPE